MSDATEEIHGAEALMSEALTIEPGFVRQQPAMRLSAGKIQDGYRSTVELPALPSVQPGQLWLVEFSPTERELSPLEYRALTTANVVIYDRSLEPVVAKSLPLGGYAEPATRGEAVWVRPLRFARDGWSVVKLRDTGAFARHETSAEIRLLGDALLGFGPALHRPVSVFANLGGQVYESIETESAEICAILDFGGADQTPSLTMIFGVAVGTIAARFSVASANGLAG